jgi:hypothetical protein
MERERDAADFTLEAGDDVLEAGRERAWRMLDFLPRGEAHPSLAATTIEMSAVTTAGGREPRRSEAVRWRRRGIAAAVLASSLAAGVVAGSRVNRMPDDPLAIAVGRHMTVLAEAGSVDFLRALSSRDIPPPRRPGGPRSEADDAVAVEPYPALDAAIADFRDALAGAPPRDPRRDEQALRAAESIPAGGFQAAMATARALAGPGAEPLVEAARRWHQWVLASDPVERRIVPTLGTKERLEWLARRNRPWRPPGFRGPFPLPHGPLPNGPPPNSPPPPVRSPREFPRENRGPTG